MPVNNMTNEVYEVNYEALYKEFMELKIYRDKRIHTSYVDKWIEILRKADAISCKDFLNPKNQKLMQKEDFEAPEKFQTTLNYKSNQLFINFRVSRICQALELLDSDEKRVQDIDIKDFIDKKLINWTSVRGITRVKSKPIIIVPFTIDKTYKMLVIDGNHRIENAIKTGQKTIKSYLLDANWLVQSNLFCTQFDKMLYIFQNEVVAMGAYILRDGLSDEDAFKRSYFLSRNVNVDL